MVPVRKDMPAADDMHQDFLFLINVLSGTASAANHFGAHSYGPLASTERPAISIVGNEHLKLLATVLDRVSTA